MICPPARRLLLSAASCLLALPAFAQSEGGTITLAVGEQKILQVSNIARVAIGEPDVADVKQVGGGNELLITGVGEGRTSLLVWQTNERRISYVVVVRKWNPKEVQAEIRALLGDREGIQIRVVGDRLYLDGETLTTDDYERVQQIVGLYPNVKSFVRPSGNAKRLAAEALNNAFRKGGLPNVKATVIGSTLFVEGWVEQKEDIDKVNQVASAVGEKVLNLVAVGQKKMILVEVEFVEVQSTDGKHVGLKLPTNIISTEPSGIAFNLVRPLPALGDASGTLPLATFSANLTGATDFSFGARFDHGFFRILSQPKLLCASGEKAEFLAGGEIPILIVTLNQFAVEWKQFGIVLKITPTADKQGNIGTEVYAEVSDVDRSLSIKANGFDVPGFRKRDVKTNVTVKDGETVVLSGLFNYDQQKAVSKFPLLGNIPILGELFKSRDFTDRKTELAIYVTPRVVRPDSERVKELINDARRLYKEAADSISFSIFD
jgi:pilus assembly protein CpaC